MNLTMLHEELDNINNSFNNASNDLKSVRYLALNIRLICAKLDNNNPEVRALSEAGSILDKTISTVATSASQIKISCDKIKAMSDEESGDK